MGAEKERPEADEIEITPEMVEAGLAELYGYSPEIDEIACLKQIFRAMIRAANPQKASP